LFLLDFINCRNRKIFKTSNCW